MRTLAAIAAPALLVVLGCGGTVGDDGAGGPRGATPGRDGGASTGSAVEICNNSLDDNGNGMVDENCSCTPGEVQSCWPGDPGARGVGACSDGVQMCKPMGEFSTWGGCIEFHGSTAEASGNGVDDDCDGAIDEGGSSGCTPDELGERCNDGADNDCDGAVDCMDPDCVADPGCTTGGGSSTCTPSEFGQCGDGLDNDCDGMGDCANPDCEYLCAGFPGGGFGGCWGIPFEVCDGPDDEDCDGATNCADSDCAMSEACGCHEVCTPGASRWCDTPIGCEWGEQTCTPTGSWGRCVETTRRPAGCERSGGAYDYECCIGSGSCCQNVFGGSSAGNCTGISHCG